MSSSKTSDVLLKSFNTAQLSDTELNLINGGEVVWVSRAFTHTGVVLIRTHDDASTTYGILPPDSINLQDISHEQLVQQGDTGSI